MSFPAPLESLPEGAVFDLVVLGAGGAGLSAAVLAAAQGARVAVVEATAHVGGSTALSAGTTWVPNTPLGAAVNPKDTPAEAARFLEAAVGVHAAPALRQALLAHGAAAVAAVQAASHLKYRPYPFHPDYLSELPGSTANGRALEPLPFDGRLLGEHFALLRPPIPEFTVLGGMMVDRTDINHLLNWQKKKASFAHAVRVLLRHAADRLRHPRGTRLVMGNALVGRLLLTLKERGVTLLMQTQAQQLLRAEGGGVAGVVVEDAQGTRRTLRALGGVLLATGGFNRHPARRAALLPNVPADWCPGAPGHQGRAQDLALALGARFGEGGQSPAFWAPVSLRKRPDGSQAVFPHFAFDRGKPHVLALNGRGERFVNESVNYHQFALAMQESGAVPAWLVTDAQGLRKYGLGMVRPKGMGLASALASGYVLRANSLAELAQATGLPAEALQRTVARFNEHARSGTDPDFQRGSTVYQRNLGDAAWTGPNPSLGALEQAPFYALKLYPGDIGAATGLVTDERARVLDAQDRPIPGLYAVGNDMQSAMGGTYPGPGITIGPGLVFAYLAVADMVSGLRVKAPEAATA